MQVCRETEDKVKDTKIKPQQKHATIPAGESDSQLDSQSEKQQANTTAMLLGAYDSYGYCGCCFIDFQKVSENMHSVVIPRSLKNCIIF